MLVLALAGEQVEEEAPDRAPLLQHFPCRHVRVPDRRLRKAAVLDAEHARRGIEDAFHHPAQLEVGAHRLRVETKLLGAHTLLQRLRIPGVDPLCRGIVAPLARQQRLVILARARLGRGGDPLDERLGGLCAADHLVLGHVCRPALVPEQPRQLVAPRQHAIEHAEVSWMRALPVHLPELLARRAAARIGHERHVVGMIGGDPARRMRPRVVRRQPLQISHLDAADVVADVALELLADADQLLVQRAGAGARLRILVHAGAPELAQHPEEVPARVLVLARGVDLREGRVDLGIERQLGGERLRFLLATLAGVPHRGVGMHRAQQGRARTRVRDRGSGLVPGTQALQGRRPRLQAADGGPGTLQVFAGRAHERVAWPGEQGSGGHAALYAASRGRRNPPDASRGPAACSMSAVAPILVRSSRTWPS